MIFLALFAVTLAGYWGLRAADYRTTRAAEALGAYEGRDSVRGADLMLDRGRFVTKGITWTAIIVALFVVAQFTTPVVHGLWLGLAGVLLVRSVMAIRNNIANARKLQAGLAGEVQQPPFEVDAATGASGAEAGQPRRGGSRRNHG